MMPLEGTRSAAAAVAPVRVAINAQINPDTAGGVESSATSIMHHYAGRSDEVEMTILGLDPYLQRFRHILGPGMGMRAWRNGEERPILATTSHPLIKRLRTHLPFTRPMIDAGVLALRRRSFERSLGSLQNNDRVLRDAGVEVVHFPYGSTFPTSLPFVFEPHDIQHRRHPEFFSPAEVSWRDRVYGDGCRNAAMVVCGSRWTKQDIMREFGVPSERIAVIPRSSVNARADVDEARRLEILRELSLPEGFAFYPAMTFPHKNHLRLFEALAELRDRHGIDLPIVMTGRSHEPHHPAVIDAVQTFGLAHQVKLLGVVPDDVLSVLFQTARFMVFPSLYEGLSQSLLEALHVGLPIVAARQSSIPETVGDAAVFFDGTDTGSIVETLRTVLTRPDMLTDAGGRASGHYARYSWDHAGPLLTAVYRHVAGRGRSVGDRALLDEALRL